MFLSLVCVPPSNSITFILSQKNEWMTYALRYAVRILALYRISSKHE